MGHFWDPFVARPPECSSWPFVPRSGAPRRLEGRRATASGAHGARRSGPPFPRTQREAAGNGGLVGAHERRAEGPATGRPRAAGWRLRGRRSA
eukprot:scaffold3258_cov382-Prasinococcus_capsulatus_cf.AAC.1